jgi:FMN-dependent NADH-azoreductase
MIKRCFLEKGRIKFYQYVAAACNVAGKYVELIFDICSITDIKSIIVNSQAIKKDAKDRIDIGQISISI